MTAKAKKPGAVVTQISDFEKNQNTGIREARRRARAAHRRIGNLKEFAFGLAANNNKQQTDIDSVASTVATIVAGVPTITNALTQLQGGLVALQGALQNQVSPALTQLGDGLTAINAALNDTTTGLVGLNLARPQFGAFGADGTIIGGTGQVSGASGPSADATQGADLTGGGGPDLEGMYVVDFGNDVSSRMYSVNVFPAGPGVATPTASAANCSVDGIDTVCGLVLNPAGPEVADPDLVLVQINDGETPHPAGFSVTALSG